MLKSFVFFNSIILGLLLFTPKLIAQDAESQTLKTQPNVIVILADDLGYADVGFNGNTDIPTPNIDRIAREGVKFTNAYVSYAVCGPSRAGILTGRYQDRFGFSRNPLLAPNDPNMGLPLSEETLADALGRAGYKSVALGKWHMGAHASLVPRKRGFTDFFGFLSGGHQYLPELWTLNDLTEARTQYDGYNTKLLRNETRVEETEYLTDALSREAVNYIRQYKDAHFFMYLAYNAPHAPLQATPEYLERFDHIKDPKRKIYAAMVSAMDDGVGRVLETLDSLKLADNTLVFFLSDNGGPEHANASDNGLLRGEKGDLFEGGIHVPFALRWPARLEGGKFYEKAISALDIFATAINQTSERIQTKNTLDGVDLIPYLTEANSGDPHPYLFWRKFDQEEYAVRAANGLKFEIQKNQSYLFDLQHDLGETNSILEERTQDSRSLKEQYSIWNMEMKDPVFLGLLQDKLYSRQNPNRFTTN
ncbi:sulfatase-like hydrolase/transferase [Leeuwenhoekiella parthenopeia]|uniref:Sulfatase-like hydrolase/transferase n=1 Tax=Leeuwenhoekiella parthenopeia TaxID=2890320 RepID=A0ABS8GNX3_9FLAO|nr:sulfatase-like hydrolase/transferase [Leeuwenhoekiella parthenopeia]MCC4211213.1 sulfatase-like hydrolase/transferase [Leeuwenhoekiella parthenopeia]